MKSTPKCPCLFRTCPCFDGWRYIINFYLLQQVHRTSISNNNRDKLPLWRALTSRGAPLSRILISNDKFQLINF